MSASEWRQALFGAWDAAKSLLGRLTGQRSGPGAQAVQGTGPPPGAVVQRAEPRPLSLSRIPEVSVELLPGEDGEARTATAAAPSPSRAEHPPERRARSTSLRQTQRRSKPKHARTRPPSGKKSR
jgi:hypothetical protein